MKNIFFTIILILSSLATYAKPLTQNEFNSAAFEVLLESSGDITNRKDRNETFAKFFRSLLSQGHSKVIGTTCNKTISFHKCELTISILPNPLDSQAAENVKVVFFVATDPNRIPSYAMKTMNFQAEFFLKNQDLIMTYLMDSP